MQLPKDDTFKTRKVNYTVIENRDVGTTLGGYACKQTLKSEQVEGFLLGGTDTINSESAIHVSPDECRVMVETKSCHGNPMSKDGKPWRFDGVPMVQAKWWRVVSSDLVNCLFESVILESSCVSCPVKAVMGELARNRSIRQSVCGRLTFIWGMPHESDIEPKCTTTIVYEEVGEVLNSTRSGSSKGLY